MKAASPPAGGGYTVGIALENFDGENSTTTTEVSLPSGRETSLTNGWTVDQQTGKITASFTAGLDLQGNSLDPALEKLKGGVENVSKILSANGKWSIDENGKLVTQDLEVKGKAKFKGTTEVGTPENPQGITLYDPSGSPYCVRVETGGAVASVAGECVTR